MATVSLDHISLSFGDRAILQDVGLTLGSGAKTALTGANGSGKTTLMKIIAGQGDPDSGAVVRSKECVVSYLPQSGLTHKGRTLWEEADRAYGEAHEHHEDLKGIEERLSQASPDSPEIDDLLHAYQGAQDRILDSGYYEREAVIDRTLRGLGFHGDDFSRPCEEFSGGWQMRIALARILLEQPDVLLLDEPTNYLDIEAREWLAAYLEDFSGALLLVSHDRHFLDTVTSHTAELFLGRLKIYPMPYSAYRKRREAEIEELKAAYARQQDEIEKTEDFIRRFRYKATKAKQVQSRVKQLDKLDRIELPEHLKTISVRFPKAPRSGDPSVEVIEVSKSYGSRDVLKNVGLEIRRGDRVVFVGANGAGKSTLMRIVAGVDRDFDGIVDYGTAVEIGYFPQDAAEGMPKGVTAVDYLRAAAPEKTETELRSLLGAFLFRGDDIFKPTDILSGGERNRLAMLRLLVHPKNLLILDEPTNHLDMSSKDILLDALSHYNGTLILVSHDRYFLEQIGTRVLHFEEVEDTPSVVSYYYGDYAYFLHRRAAVESLSPPEAASDVKDRRPKPIRHMPGPAGPGAEAAPGVENDSGDSVLTREERKAAKTRLRKAETTERELLDEIDRLEARRAGAENRLADPEVYKNGDLVREIKAELEDAENKKADAIRKWEDAAAEAERMRLVLD